MEKINAKPGKKYITRSGEVVSYLKSWIRNHKVFLRENGEWFLTTEFGNALNMRDDIMKVAD